MEGAARIELMLEMAKLAAERLDKGDEAIRLLKEVLVFGAGGGVDAESVLDQLERQAERQKDFHTVAYVLERRIEKAEGAKAKNQLLQKLGALYADKIEDAEASQKAWRRVLELSPGHKRALRVLRQSYVAAKDWEGLEGLYASAAGRFRDRTGRDRSRACPSARLPYPSSLFYQKLARTQECGRPMPPASTPVSEASLAGIHAWISGL